MDDFRDLMLERLRPGQVAARRRLADVALPMGVALEVAAVAAGCQTAVGPTAKAGAGVGGRVSNLVIGQVAAARHVNQ